MTNRTRVDKGFGNDCWPTISLTYASSDCREPTVLSVAYCDIDELDGATVCLVSLM